MRENARMDYVEVAQPRVVALFTLTVLATMLLGGIPGAPTAIAVLAATALTVAGAATLNNHLERELDRRMERTRRRPTATGRVTPRGALVAGLGATAAGALALWAVAGGLAAGLALGGAAYYVVVYTVVLKPRTPLSSVPGGLAGVFPALIGWAATGAPPSGALLFVCALIVVWSPPHFWALALARDDDYRAAGVATPAVRYGDETARRLVLGFVAALTAVTLAPIATGLFGLVYAPLALLATAALWAFTLRLRKRRSPAAAWALFKASGPYLATVLAAAVLDRLL
jgi:protoheme IX farnesyltransferase